MYRMYLIRNKMRDDQTDVLLLITQRDNQHYSNIRTTILMEMTLEYHRADCLWSVDFRCSSLNIEKELQHQN